MDRVAVIIVNYNSNLDTVACLKSLAKVNATGLDVKTVVVDNGSQDSLVLPKTSWSKKINLIRSQSNLGFTGGNNLGISYAREKYEPDYVLLLNNDTVVDPEFLQHLCGRAKADSQAGLLSPKIYFTSGHEFHKSRYQDSDRGKVLWYAGGSIDWVNLVAFHRGVDEVDRGQVDQQTSSDFGTGCCLLISRKVIETVGLLDKNYFLYLEDVDYNLRVQNAGFKILFVPQAVIWHHNAGSSGGPGQPTSQYYQNRNRLYFCFKHGSWRNKLTCLRIMIQLLSSANQVDRQAALDFLLGRMGKQTIV